MRNTFLIAQREYLAFVRTVGFWLSLFTVPLLIVAVILVPLLLTQTAPVKTMSVAVLDLSGEGLEPELRAMVQAKADALAAHDDALARMAARMAHQNEVRLVALPAGLTPIMSRAEAAAKMPGLLSEDSGKPSTILLAYDEGDQLHFDIWSVPSQAGDLKDMIEWDLHGLQYEKVARLNGIDAKLAHDMREARADIASLTPQPAAGEAKSALSDKGAGFIGFMLGFATWMTIFSSSMILLGGVIEEKSSKVLEVLLASTSTESLLIGKVLGVAMVLLTVGGIWGCASLLLGTYGMSSIPPHVISDIKAAAGGLLSPLHLGLLAVYFVFGYLMYGVSFAAIGAFCETQKDAQAVMGPVMMVLMIPMLCMQAALQVPDSPIIRWLSYVPIFTPFLMPLRLAQPLPMWEIVATLGGMVIVGGFMIVIGRKAFKQGALTGGKLTWGTLFRIATQKPAA
jgi:ABC-2 type transport system permease protein